MTKPQTINLHAGHPDYVIAPGLSNVILYHGSPVDLRKVSIAKAEQLANDPVAKYVQHSPERKAKDAKAAAAASR
jgi:hypothetical protein